MSENTVQSELDGIQRRFRDMEAKHRLSNDDSIQTIRMQRSKIDKLKNDNERLKEELALETKQTQSKTNSKSKPCHQNNEIASIAESGEMYLRKIDIEKKRIAELDLQIGKMSESILQQRSDMGGINANRETSMQIKKNIRMLENRLDKALVKYNEALGHNKKLRTQIDNLRRERIVFDGIYKKLENDLLGVKNAMAAIITEANHAYIQRDYAQAEMVRLKDGADAEQKQFEAEWKELIKLIDADQRMKDFLINKDRESMNDAVVTSVLEQEQALRKKISKSAWQIVKDKAHIHMAQEKVKAFRESFDKISSATGIDDIDCLVASFTASEQANFKLFNQVNKLNNQIERIEEQINNTQHEIALINDGNGDVDDVLLSVNEDHPNQRQFILANLKNKINATDAKTTEYKAKYQESVRTMASLKDGINAILNKIGCANGSDNKAMMDMIKNTGVTESNVMEILGVIEQKTNGLIAKYVQLQLEDAEDAATAVENKENINLIVNNNNNKKQEKKMEEDKQLDDKQAEAASLGIGIGAAALQPLVPTPASIFDDFSDEDDENNDDDNQILQ